MTLNTMKTAPRMDATPEPVNGAAMDERLPARKRRWPLIAGAGLLLAALLGYGLWHVLPHGLSVQAKELRVVAVERGVFRDDITVRATASALSSIMLDAADRGRVDEVYVRDGALVKQGQLLFRLSNPQRRMDLLQRQSEQAQQVSNLSNFNVSAEAARSDAQRRLKQLEFDVREAEKAQERNEKLATQGFIAQSALQDSTDKLATLRRSLQDERNRNRQEAETRSKALQNMERAVEGMRPGLQLFTETIDALGVRAPVAGRLTDFNLQIGEAVRVDQRVGRIDDPASSKLTAQVDEYYLPRVAVGQQGSATIGGKSFPVAVKTVYAQVKDGRFAVDLIFPKDKPDGLRPGLSVDLRITLGEPVPALVLANDSFLNETGGAWVFVLSPNGEAAERRPIRIGRRSNDQVEILSGLKQGERIIVSSYAAFGKAEHLAVSN